VPADLRAAIALNPRARRTFRSLSRMNLFALVYRTNAMKTPAGRAKKIAASRGHAGPWGNDCAGTGTQEEALRAYRPAAPILMRSGDQPLDAGDRIGRSHPEFHNAESDDVERRIEVADGVDDLIDGRAAGRLHQRVGKLHRIEHVEIEMHVDLREAGGADAAAHAIRHEQIGRRQSGDRGVAGEQDLVAVEVADTGKDDCCADSGGGEGVGRAHRGPRQAASAAPCRGSARLATSPAC
jgi:hypothetical protein